ncbi:hypothetical protein L202_03779 [Cryptococcus amylolentus CBS 6039]|uniref:Uncharacterized protein n=2 Tax=Cryptococcus amylolentus TaxID=104669 RepID=A0A1E3HVW3_9TREE|nr:hypothetical protein L202_03779 [Cryptococcus amylolentus CBS 6039]ODN79886.1 hypothetical protein L202_03779 [Cryptococcus amylolentus CBS 6039]ODO08149.1 hypothetical protein I350_03738 [Cryptococcus amylolentus CBS 6273]
MSLSVLTIQSELVASVFDPAHRLCPEYLKELALTCAEPSSDKRFLPKVLLGRVGYRTKGPEDDLWFFDTFTYNGQAVNRNDLCRCWAITIDMVFFLEWITNIGFADKFDRAHLLELIPLYQGTSGETDYLRKMIEESECPVRDLYEAMDCLAQAMTRTMHELRLLEIDQQLLLATLPEHAVVFLQVALNYRHVLQEEEEAIIRDFGHPKASTGKLTMLHHYMNRYVGMVDIFFAWGSFPSQQWALCEVMDDVEMRPLHRKGAIRGKSGRRTVKGIHKGLACVV